MTPAELEIRARELEAQAADLRAEALRLSIASDKPPSVAPPMPPPTPTPPPPTPPPTTAAGRPETAPTPPALPPQQPPPPPPPVPAPPPPPPAPPPPPPVPAPPTPPPPPPPPPTTPPAQSADEQRKAAEACAADLNCADCKYGIAMPTYFGHLNEFTTFLKSLPHNAEDFRSVRFLAVVGGDGGEKEAFQGAVNGLGFKNVFVESINHILSRYPNVPADLASSWNFGYGKFPYQGVKKIYGARYVNCKQVLLIDSETTILKPMRFQDAFEDYNARPLLLWHPVCPKYWAFCSTYSNEAYAMIKSDSTKFPERAWFFEAQNWFLERNMLNEYLSHLENIWGKSYAQISSQFQNSFEMSAFWSYIYLNREKYPQYQIMSVREMMAPYFGSKIDQYIAQMCVPFGMTEHIMANITQDLYPEWREALTKLKWRFVRTMPPDYPGWADNMQVYYKHTVDLIARMVVDVPTLTVEVCSSYDLTPTINALNPPWLANRTAPA